MEIRTRDDSVFGKLTLIIDDEHKVWFVLKEICNALNIKRITNKFFLDFISKNNIIKYRRYDYRNNEAIFSALWGKPNDHADKYLINKFGVLQVISLVNAYNTNPYIEHFIGFTFKDLFKDLNKNNRGSEQTSLSEINKLRLKLFSDNALEVVNAHKALLKLEINNKDNNNKTEQTSLVKSENIVICGKCYNSYKEVVNDLVQTKLCYEREIKECSDLQHKYESLERTNELLKKENRELQNKVGRGSEWSTVAFMKKEWAAKFNHVPNYRDLKRISLNLGIMPIKDVIEKDKKGIERKVNRYHNDVWKVYEEEEIEKKKPKTLPLEYFD